LKILCKSIVRIISIIEVTNHKGQSVKYLYLYKVVDGSQPFSLR